MPTFKHPCPHCGKYIDRDVAACPFCWTADPFAPARCTNCRAVIEDPAWFACPKCGQPLAAKAPVRTQPTSNTQPTGRPTGPPPPPPAPAVAPAPPQPVAADSGRVCSGCGAPLADGARFCPICGTLAA